MTIIIVKQIADQSYRYLETAPSTVSHAIWSSDMNRAFKFMFQDDADETLDDLSRDQTERNRAWSMRK